MSSSKRLQTATILTENDGDSGSEFESEPKNYSVEQMKRWLKYRGFKQAGKRSELLARVNDALKFGNHHILDSSIDDSRWYVDSRFLNYYFLTLMDPKLKLLKGSSLQRRLFWLVMQSSPPPPPPHHPPSLERKDCVTSQKTDCEGGYEGSSKSQLLSFLGRLFPKTLGCGAVHFGCDALTTSPGVKWSGNSSVGPFPPDHWSTQM